MSTSVELRQQRARVVESLRAIVDAAEGESRDLSAEERQSYERHEEDFRALTARIERTESQEQREAEQAAPIGSTGPVDGTGAASTEERQRQARSAFAAFIRGGRAGLSPEQRALVENTAGEILVPEDLEAEIYRELPALTVMRGLATVRTTNRDRVRRRSLTEVSVGWGKLETAAQTLTDSMPVTPTEDYSYVEDLYGLAKIGEDEFDDTDVNLEGFVRDSFSRALGEAEDTGFAVGTGHSNDEPVGIFSGNAATGITEVASGQANLAAGLSADDFKKLIYATPAQYRRGGSFLMASATELALSILKDGNGRYLWEPNTQAGRPNSFLGYAINNQEDVATLAASKLYAAFGDYKAGYRVLDRLGMTVQRLVELYAEDGMVGFKVRRRTSGDVVRPNAIRVLKAPAA